MPIVASINKFSSFLENIFKEAMLKISPNLVTLVKILKTEQVKKSIKKNGKVSINNEYMKATIISPEMKVSKTTLLRRGNRRSTTNISVPTGDIELQKMVRGIMPNWIHSKDSCILISTIEQCKNRDIKISPQHDCLTVDVEYKDDVIEFYGLSYYQKVLKTEHDVRKLLIDNDVKITSTVEKYIKTIENNRNNINKKIDAKTLIIGKNILS